MYVFQYVLPSTKIIATTIYLPISAAVCGKRRATFHTTASPERLTPVACHLGLGIILWFTTIVAYDINPKLAYTTL